MKKILLVSLMILSLMAVISANGKSGDSGKMVAVEKNVNPAGVFPVVKSPWTMTVMFPQSSLVEDIETNKLTLLQEAKTGIHVNWQLIPEKNVQEKVNLVFASGTDLPDVMLGCNGGLSNAAQVQYGSQGLILPLNDLIDEYGIEFEKILSIPEFVNFRAQITAPSGEIYSLPKIVDSNHNQYSARLYINTTWLDALGLDMPTTTDEFYKVLKAFKEQDPNGNGKPDEIPLVGAITGWRSEIDIQIMNSFIYNDGRNQNRFSLKNGKINVSYITEEWREGLRYMAKLTKEGLLDPVSFTQDQNQLKQLMGNEEVPLVGVVTGGSMAGAISLKSDNRLHYYTIPPLEGPTGRKGTAFFPTQAQTGIFAITSDCENPEAAFRWADWMYTEERSMAARYGEKGTDWVYADKGELNAYGEQALLKTNLPWAIVQNSHWTFREPGYNKKEFTGGRVAILGEWQADNMLIKDTLMYQPVAPKLDEVLPSLFFTEDEVDEYLDLSTTINGYVEESIARFVTGNLSIDSDWDEYLAELENMGLKRYVEINQQVYNRQYK